MKLLLADDDPTIRSELAELLRGSGHEVHVAADGAEALRKVETETFDAALLDLVMPHATGLDVLRRIQVVRPSIAVLMISGQGTIDVAVEAMKTGAVDFIVKPFELEALERTLRAIEEERQARQMIAQPAADRVAVQATLEDASRRKALLAVLGPRATAPARAARVLRLDEEPGSPDTFSPGQLYRLNAAIEEHLARTERPVVYGADLDLVEKVHGRADLKAWVRQVSNRCGARGGSLVLASLDPGLAAELEADAGPVEPEGPLQGMLESLANPTRRAIVSYVFSSGPVAYSSILKRKFVDSSSKLSFHLQKLQTDGLLSKVEGGAYALTGAGRSAWRVMRALGDERRRPTLVLLH